MILWGEYYGNPQFLVPGAQKENVFWPRKNAEQENDEAEIKARQALLYSPALN